MMRRPVAVLLSLVACPLFAATFTVTSPAEAGAGSLRQAILDANATPGLDQIVFTTNVVIGETPLPAITDPVTIDGSDGVSGRHSVTATGMTTTFTFIFAAGSSGSTLRDLELVNATPNPRNHILLRIDAGVENVLVTNNIIGRGIVVSGNNNTIRGNVLSIGSSIAPEFNVSGSGNQVLGNTNLEVFVGGVNNRIGAIGSGNTGTRVITNGTGTIIEANDVDGISVFGDNTQIRFNTVSGFVGFLSGGIEVDPGATSVEISQNEIYDVTSNMPIDLGRDGVTPNDPSPDADTGANELQNFPVITSAVRSGTSITVTGSLTSAPLTPYDIEFFYDFEYVDSGSPTPTPELRVYVDTIRVTTNAAGVATFTHTITNVSLPPADPRPVSEFILATATNRGVATTPGNTPNSTSEASAPTTVELAAAGTLGFENATYTVDEATGSIVITVTRTGGSEGTVAVNYVTSNGTATAPGDYTTTSGTLVFGPGVTSQAIVIPIVNDNAPEANETFGVTLSDPTNGATVGTATTVVTITDTDAAPGVAAVPTASTWALIAMALGLTLIALLRT